MRKINKEKCLTKNFKNMMIICTLSLSVFAFSGCSSGSANLSSEKEVAPTAEVVVSPTAEVTEEPILEPTAEPELSDDSSSTTSSANTESAEVDGALAPFNIYNLCQENEVVPYVLNDKATTFLQEHPELFPTKDIDSIADFIDNSLEYKHIAKNAQKYGEKLMALPLVQVVEIYEEELDSFTFTDVNVIDENGQQYYVLYIGTLDDVFEGDLISVEGLPLGTSSFANTDGGETVVAVLAGSFVEKAVE